MFWAKIAPNEILDRRLAMVLANSPRTESASAFAVKFLTVNIPDQSLTQFLFFHPGGHTSEMIRLMASLSHHYSPRYYVLADTDKTSEDKVHRLEKSKKEFFQQTKVGRCESEHPEVTSTPIGNTNWFGPSQNLCNLGLGQGPKNCAFSFVHESALASKAFLKCDGFFPPEKLFLRWEL